MAIQGQAKIVVMNTVSVIPDTDQARTALFYNQFDASRPGVQAVLQQFLDHRRRPFYYLAGGDLISKLSG